MSVTLIQQQLSEAIEYARMLLEAHQQRLPDTLTVALEAAIQAWEANQPDSARLSLEQAITLAQETTYL
jgi:predicted negative regulator of RcsB-dependent stress response